ncbi:hypothetical protein ACXYL9_02765 [Qipengyuania sp. CAU 1752]
MKGYIFQNRWGALLFVGLTLIGAASLVGTEDTEGTLAEAAAQLEQQGADYREQAAGFSQPDQAENGSSDGDMQYDLAGSEVVEFASEEELVVDPIGIDPTPIIEDPAKGEVILIQD